jgi:catechol 2,3-dioxygenase-like lactoylglutathione lyase family enzyme
MAEFPQTNSWVKGIEAITLFIDNIATSKNFYIKIFGLPVFYENADSVVFKFGNTLINLLKVANAPELIEPAQVAIPESGSRLVFTLAVDNVDAMCKDLVSKGVKLLNGPMDRPWGIRTASFQDPDGYIWEIAK